MLWVGRGSSAFETDRGTRGDESPFTWRNSKLQEAETPEIPETPETPETPFSLKPLKPLKSPSKTPQKTPQKPLKTPEIPLKTHLWPRCSLAAGVVSAGTDVTSIAMMPTVLWHGVANPMVPTQSGCDPHDTTFIRCQRYRYRSICLYRMWPKLTWVHVKMCFTWAEHEKLASPSAASQR